MTIDWAELNKKTKGYRSLSLDTDPISGWQTINFCGLEAKLSEILSVCKNGDVYSLSIFADTLVIDVPSITVTGLILTARCVDVSALKSEPLTLKSRGQDLAVQAMIGKSMNGTFSMKAAGGSGCVTPRVRETGLVSNVYLMTPPFKDLTPMPGDNMSNVRSLVSQSWTLNANLSSFDAATYLMSSQTELDQAAARDMLSWIVACAGSLSGQNGGMPADYAQLYTQAAALLTTLTVAPGAVFVPTLSSDIYKNDLPKLIDVLSGYEADMNELTTGQDIDKAIATVAAGLADTASIEETPLKNRLENLKTNTTQLADDIRVLQVKFQMQESATQTSFDVMETYIELAKIKAQLEKELKLAMTLIGAGISALKVEEDPFAIGDVIEKSIEAIQQGVELIETMIPEEGPDSLASGATDLLNMQSALMVAFFNSRTLWADIEKGKSGSELPINPASVTIDPVTDWNNYQARADAEIRGLRNDAGSAAGYVDQYQANLQILIGYGKAICTKLVAYVTQTVAATEVVAQIQAAEKVEQNWRDVEKNAKSDSQKLAALKALILSRENVVRRSIYVSWTYYADAYFYLNFERPQPVLTVDMSSAEMKHALTNVNAWIEAALGNSPDGQHIMLPSTDASISLEFDISTKSNPSGASAVASVRPDDKGGWTVLWVVDVGTEQLNGVLPNNGNVAIWITEAEFFLEGVTPNNKGNVLTDVATSGTYENGFGLADNHVFATKGLEGSFLYQAADKKVYSPWKIDSSVYMMPTPFTQWRMSLPSGGGDPSTASKLKLNLKIAYQVPKN